MCQYIRRLGGTIWGIPLKEKAMRRSEGKSEIYPGAAIEAAAQEQYQLGLAYSVGQEGVPVNYVMAHMWLDVAAINGNVVARDLREEISMNMSHEDITEAQRLARQWVEAHY